MDKKRTYVLELTTPEVATILVALGEHIKNVKAIPNENVFIEEWKRRQAKNVETIKQQLP